MKPMMQPTFAASLLVLLALGACAPQATTGWNSSPETTAGPAIAAPDTVSLRLAEAAEKAANSLDNIARLEGNKPIEGDAGGIANTSEKAGNASSGALGNTIGNTGVSSGQSTNLTSAPASMLPVGGYGAVNNVPYAVAPPAYGTAPPQQPVQPQPQYQSQQAMAPVMVQPYQTPQSMPPMQMGAPTELTAPVTIKWYGPIEPLLGKLASRAGYAFRPEGAGPPVPLTVSIDAYNQPLIDVIKSASLQVAGKADVDLDAGAQTLTLRYAPVDAGSY